MHLYENSMHIGLTYAWTLIKKLTYITLVYVRKHIHAQTQTFFCIRPRTYTRTNNHQSHCVHHIHAIPLYLCVCVSISLCIFICIIFVCMYARVSDHARVYVTKRVYSSRSTQLLCTVTQINNLVCTHACTCIHI